MAQNEILWIVIVGLIVFFLVVGFIVPQLFGQKIEILKIGTEKVEKTETGLSPPDVQVFKKDVLKIISKGDAYSQAEIGCSVAQDVVNDYIRYGTKGQRKFCSNNLCLAAYGGFKLKQEAITAEQGKTLNDFGCAACDPLLDENCISKNLAKQTVSETSFCNHFLVTVGGESLITGNSKCEANLNRVDDVCDFICPGGNIIKQWRADGASQYNVSDANILLNGPLVDNKSYIYVLQWDVFSKSYTLDFARVPETFDAGQFNDSETLAGFTYGTFLINPRFLEAGLWKPELRRSADFNFTVSNDIYLTDFASKAEHLPLIKDVVYRSCSGEDCIEGYIQDVLAFKTLSNDATLYIRSSIEDDGKLLAGKTYRMVLSNWLKPSGSFYTKADYTVALFEVS